MSSDRCLQLSDDACSHLFDDVTDVQQPLLVDHPPVENASDDQLTALHLERHTLKRQKSFQKVPQRPWTEASGVCGVV